METKDIYHLFTDRCKRNATAPALSYRKTRFTYKALLKVILEKGQSWKTGMQAAKVAIDPEKAGIVSVEMSDILEGMATIIALCNTKKSILIAGSPPAEGHASLLSCPVFLFGKGEGAGLMEVTADALHETFLSLDRIIDGSDHRQVLIYGNLPTEQLVTELLWGFTRGLHFTIPDGAATIPLETYFPSATEFPMKFSLFYFGSSPTQKDDGGRGMVEDRDAYHFVFESAKYADRNGYTAVWTPERHFNAFGGLFPNPSVLSAALAAITENIGIRCGSLVSPLHHTIRIAEDWALIDRLSGGRAALSFASGWQCDDFILYPERYADRHRQMMEQIGEIKKLWMGEKVTRRNGQGHEVTIGIFPTPLQASIPIWVTVSGKTETFIEAGSIGANILTHLLWQDPSELRDKIQAYRSSLAENGYDPDTRIVTVMLHTYIGEDTEKVKQQVRPVLKEYIRTSIHLIEAMVPSTKVQGVGNNIGRYGNMDGALDEKLMDQLLEIAFNRMYEQAGLLGDRSACHRILRQLHDYGVNELACLIDFGLPEDIVLHGLEDLSRLKDLYDPLYIGRDHFNLLFVDGSLFSSLSGQAPASECLNRLKGIVTHVKSGEEALPVPRSVRIPVMNLVYDLSNSKPGAAIAMVKTGGETGKIHAPAAGSIKTVLNEEFD
ncbi:MAG TPA: MupA/Atu3671 family FMN-dependent luciferase-like monooxygenase [Puia sp.]|nr:MupA/Atu3671 family FMN-dependent luciferase-like monooxygenase [Puia sp.]